MTTGGAAVATRRDFADRHRFVLPEPVTYQPVCEQNRRNPAAAVVAVPDEKCGERPPATVVRKGGASVGYEELKDFLATSGIAKWQLPERWTVIPAVPDPLRSEAGGDHEGGTGVVPYRPRRCRVPVRPVSQFVPIFASRSTMRDWTSSLVDRSARKSTVSPELSFGSSDPFMSAEV